MNTWKWKPIAQIRKEPDGKYTGDLLLRAPQLVNLDCNPQGVAPGYWQDGTGWIAAGYDMCQDVFTTIVVRPTHYVRIKGPRQ